MRGSGVGSKAPSLAWQPWTCAMATADEFGDRKDVGYAAHMSSTGRRIEQAREESDVVGKIDEPIEGPLRRDVR